MLFIFYEFWRSNSGLLHPEFGFCCSRLEIGSVCIAEAGLKCTMILQGLGFHTTGLALELVLAIQISYTWTTR